MKIILKHEGGFLKLTCRGCGSIFVFEPTDVLEKGPDCVTCPVCDTPNHSDGLYFKFNLSKEDVDLLIKEYGDNTRG